MAMTIILSRKCLPKGHGDQYPALCPLCAATRYHEFITTLDESMDKLKDKIANTKNYEIPISPGDEKTSIRFREDHLERLKII